MTHPSTHLILAADRSQRLQSEAADWRRANEAARPVAAAPELRSRLGWTLVGLGLRLAAPPRHAAPQL